MSGLVPILTFHSIDERRLPVSTPPAVFEEQLAALGRARFRTASVTEVATCLREGRRLPERTVVLTFDDGYRNFAERAWPALRRHGFGATLFAVAPRPMGRNDWDEGPGTLAGEPLLGGDDLRRLAAEGVEIGAHSLTHRRLTDLPALEIDREIAGSSRILSETVGQPVRVFAYPYGIHDARTRAAAARSCDAACTTRMGYAGRRSDPFRLERIDAYYLRPAGMAARLDHPSMRAYVAIRGLLRVLRWGSRLRGSRRLSETRRAGNP